MRNVRFAAVLSLFVLGQGLALGQEPPPPPPPPSPEETLDRLLRDFIVVVPRGTRIDVQEMLSDLSRRIQKPIIADPQLTQTQITFLTETNLNFSTFQAILQIYGIELITRWVGPDPEDIVIFAMLQRTVPTLASYATRWFDSGAQLPVTEEVVTAVFPVHHADANGIFAAIRGMMSRDQRRLGNVVYVRGSEVLILTDLVSNVRFYGRMIEALDAEGPQLTQRAFQLHNALAADVATAVNEAIQYQTQAATQSTGAAPVRPAPRLIADQRTNKIIAIGLGEDIDTIVAPMIREFDVSVPPLPRQFHVYRCQNADAVDLASKLMELFSGVAGQTRQQQQRSTGTTTRQAGTRTQQQQTAGTTGQTPPPTQTAPTTPYTGGTTQQPENLNPAQQEIPTRIVADEQTNSLLIQANPTDYQTILTLLEQLDQKRRRVFIEAQVWEVEVTDEMTLAFELGAFEPPDPADPHAGGGFLSGQGLSNVIPQFDSSGNLTDLIRIPFGVSAAGGSLPQGLSGLVFRDDLNAVPLILNAVASDSDNNILTTPFALVNDGGTASFEVTRSEPFQTSTLGGSLSQSGFDFAEARSLLEISPRISSEDNLSLDITLQIANFAGQAPIAGGPPPTQSRSYQGEVTIPNRHYIVIGGLEQERIVYTTSKIPFLGDIPLLGYLFRTTTERTVRTRVFMFIRPVIMAEDTFEEMISSSLYIHDGIRAGSDFERTSPLIPDSVLDAVDDGYSGTLPAMMFEIFGERAHVPASVATGDPGVPTVVPQP